MRNWGQGTQTWFNCRLSRLLPTEKNVRKTQNEKTAKQTELHTLIAIIAKLTAFWDSFLLLFNCCHPEASASDELISLQVLLSFSFDWKKLWLYRSWWIMEKWVSW